MFDRRADGVIDGNSWVECCLLIPVQTSLFSATAMASQSESTHQSNFETHLFVIWQLPVSPAKMHS
jgi:hypothetical protein